MPSVRPRSAADDHAGFRRMFRHGHLTLGDRQAEMVARWSAQAFAAAPECFKPVLQRLCVELADDASQPPAPIEHGFRSGRRFLLRFLDALRVVGIHHVILDLEHGERPVGDALEEIGIELLPALAAAQGDKPSGGELEPSDAAPELEPTPSS